MKNKKAGSRLFPFLLPEHLDFVVLQEWQKPELGGQPKACDQLRHCWGLLVSVQPHRSCLQTPDWIRLQPLQKGHQAHVGGPTQQGRREVSSTKKYVPIHVFPKLILTSIWVFLGVIRWLISLDRNMRSLHLDNFWMEVLLLLIGEAFGEHHGQLVNGAVVNIRGKGDKIAIWMSR